MSRRSLQERIDTLTEEALEAYARSCCEVPRRQGRLPRPGDLFVLAETAAFAVEWAVMARDPEDPRFLLAVAVDMNPMIGGSDLSVPAGALSGPLSARCDFVVRLAVERVAAARRTGRLEPEHLERIRGKRTEIEQRTASGAGSILRSSTDHEPEYRDWVEEVLEVAHATLLDTMGRHEPSPESSGKADGAGRVSARGPFSGPFRLAAAILLAATLGFLAGAAWQHRLEESSQPLINLPVALLGPAGTVRGQVHTLSVPLTASHFLVLVELNTRYPAYRMEVREQGAGKPVWTNDVMKAGKMELSVALPRRLFPAGKYRIHLYGLDGEADLLEEYALRIEVE